MSMHAWPQIWEEGKQVYLGGFNTEEQVSPTFLLWALHHDLTCACGLFRMTHRLFCPCSVIGS